MARLSAKLRSVSDGRIAFWCPGCEGAHVLRINAGSSPTWSFDDNVDAPTFAPSVLVTYESLGDADPEPPPERCHSFVRAGNIEFLADSTHALAGQTVPLPDWPAGEPD